MKISYVVEKEDMLFIGYWYRLDGANFTSDSLETLKTQLEKWCSINKFDVIRYRIVKLTEEVIFDYSKRPLTTVTAEFLEAYGKVQNGSKEDEARLYDLQGEILSLPHGKAWLQGFEAPPY